MPEVIEAGGVSAGGPLELLARFGPKRLAGDRGAAEMADGASPAELMAAMIRRPNNPRAALNDIRRARAAEIRPGGPRT